MEEDHILNYVYFDKYKPEKKIGQGSFGKIYQGVSIPGNEKEEKEKNLLETETYRMIYLKGDGVPKVQCFGNDNKNNILVMELLGRSLDSYFTECGKRFKFLTVCHLGIEMVKRIRYIHDKNHIHRDIKPENFVMGIDKSIDKLYIIDFGLAKKYRSSKTHQHIPFKVHKKLTGTIRYSSINASQCYEQSRRDDLESIGYLLCYFLKGTLPWQGLKIASNEDRYKMIYKKKKTTKSEDLAGAYHINLVKFVDYCRNLGFEDEPKYDYLIDLLHDAMDLNQLKIDFDFDWYKDKSSFSSSSKTNDSNLDPSLNLSNIKNKNSNSNNYSSLINKNDISQDLKLIIIEDNNSIKEYKEKEKLENEKNLNTKKTIDANENPNKKHNYNTDNTKGIKEHSKPPINKNVNYKSNNEKIHKLKEDVNKATNPKESTKEPEKIVNNLNKEPDKIPTKVEENSLCTFV